MNKSILEPSTTIRSASVADLESLIFHIKRNGGTPIRALSVFDGLRDFFRDHPEYCKDVSTALEWVEHAFNSRHWEQSLEEIKRTTP